MASDCEQIESAAAIVLESFEPLEKLNKDHGNVVSESNDDSARAVDEHARAAKVQVLEQHDLGANLEADFGQGLALSPERILLENLLAELS